VASTDFDLVLMDVRMPEMDGLEATRRIRALGGQRGQIPIVAVTAQVFSEQVAACREAGMNSHLSKPFSPDVLLAAVAKAVRSEEQGLRHIPRSTSPTPESGSEPIILDQIAFDRIGGYLAPEAVDSYLREIVSCGETLLRRLAEAGALTGTDDKLVVEAHALASRAGMFGFARVAALCRRFEASTEFDSPETPAIAGELCAAIESTLQAIHALPTQRSIPDNRPKTVNTGRKAPARKTARKKT
jgi:HPt (histidine-containing phosphotransfer) domain-containing protein